MKGRPKVPACRKRKKLNVTVPACLIEAAAKQAEQQGIALSHLVERAIREQIRRDEK